MSTKYHVVCTNQIGMAKQEDIIPVLCTFDDYDAALEFAVYESKDTWHKHVIIFTKEVL